CRRFKHATQTQQVRKTGYILDVNEMTWSDSNTSCEKRNSTLVQILDKETNSEIKNLLPKGSTVWIGLKMAVIWHWSSDEEIRTFTNWQPGQPDMLTDALICVAAELKDGTWTDEPCTSKYPFFCQGSMNE
uniref:C-type lectin domain-containing protein n=1 Tax=Stegastes partitus TaxID=144197 RepID=A0A3B4Z4J1_9TELE